MSSTDFTPNVPEWVNRISAYATEANQVCHFSRRKRSLDSARFVTLLVWGWLTHPQSSLNQLADFAVGLGIAVSAQALDARVNSRAVLLLMQVLQSVLHQHLRLPALPSERLQQFKGIYITDSTQVGLPAHLSALFAGQGTGAQVKVQLCLEYLRGNLSALDLESGRTPDQSCLLPVKFGQPGSLHLFDLGYFKQDHLHALHHQQAFYVTRLQSQTALYDRQTGERLDLVADLRLCSPLEQLEWDVTLGARVRTPARLLARRLPPDVAAARRRRAKRKAREDGKMCSTPYLDLQDWDVYLTNLPSSWTRSDIEALYRLRWQIELIFRTWKSQLHLAHFGNWRTDRVLCQFYAHLIGCVLVHALTAPWRYRDTAEFSLVKLLQLLQRHLPRFWRDPPDVFSANLEGAFRRFARKDRRKKAPSSLSAFMD